MKYRKIYFAISGIVIALCIFSLWQWGLNLGLDFSGGSMLEYNITQEFSTEELSATIEENGYQVSSIQTAGEDRYLVRTSPIKEEDKNNITDIINEYFDTEVELLRFETVGPSIGPELVKKTVYAILIASGGILLWVAYQFKSLKYGISAVLAMLHDSFILIGSFSLLGHFYGAEIDFLFVTALLTTLSFSVHDTIVVYDRIRESQNKHGGGLYELANKAITETMVRSLNNSFTIIFMLLALLLLGGSTMTWFATALFIGTILGTYSSPFVAVPLLVTIDSFIGEIKKRS